MEQLSVRLLLTAGILLLIAGGIFAILQGWLYTGLLWAGAFGCLMAALNFRDRDRPCVLSGRTSGRACGEDSECCRHHLGEVSFRGSQTPESGSTFFAGQ